MDRFEQMKWNNTLQSFSNPMQNLFSMMHQCAANMGVAKYAEVLQDIDEANKIMCKALQKAQEITYSLDE